MRQDLRRLQGAEFHLSSTPAMWQYNGWWLNAETWVLTSPTGRTLTDFSPEEISFLRSRMRSEPTPDPVNTESQ